MADISWLSRTQLMVGENGLQQLQNAHILVVGLEALAHLLLSLSLVLV
ncbi:MAG: hypothetical protein R2822_01675 [Spirosomataceae bacterium]